VLRDGWFYSGDGGSISEDGHIVFLDRVKDLVELSNGHKLAPQLLESRLRFSPFIKDAWVVAGGNRTYASAIIVIDYDTVGPWAGQKKLVYHSFAELSQKLEVYRLVRSYIHKVNLDLPDGCRVKKYVNLHKEFDPEDGELTRTRKLKRGFLEERYRWLIHAIYDNKTEVSVEVDMNHRIGRTGIIGTPIRIQPVEGAN
jgi:long-chain acyl-CoA synthetase